MSDKNLKRPVIALAFAAIALVICALSVQAVETIKTDNKSCIACHGSEEAARNQLIYVDAGIFAESIHANLRCTDCHEDAGKMTDDEELPHAKRLGPVNCTGCHYTGNPEGAPNFSPMKQYRTSVHGRASIEKGDRDVATCSDCHGKHNIRPASDPESTIYRANIPRTCAVCHDDMQMILKHNVHAEQPYREYQQSAHGKALFKDGLVSLAAVCTDCHGVHDIQANGAVALKPHQPGTCGRCHVSEYLAYTRSVHGTAFKQNITDAPVCADCHGEHDIVSPWDPQSSVSSLKITHTCANCHNDVTMMNKYNILTDRVSTYRHSDHGMGKDLGIVSVATCVSCHGFHDILPASDPDSSINPRNMQKTCGIPNCHPDPSAEILQSKIHVDRNDPDIESLRRIRTIAVWSLGALCGMGIVSGVLLFSIRLRRHRRQN